MKLKVGIIDYGIGNWESIKNILFKLGLRTLISDDYKKLDNCDLCLLPGVGAFRPAMKALEKRRLNEFIFEYVENNKPLIGICLGMQLLGRSSSENEFTKGLNLIPEDVLPLNNGSCHIGWNSIKFVKKDSFFKFRSQDALYFNHSYAFSSNLKYSICETTFNSHNFTSIIRKNNIVGFQFHPEKSQRAGLTILKNLIYKICSND